MANWCKTEYTFVGDSESLKGIYALMRGIEESETKDGGGDSCSAQLSSLVTLLGRDRRTIKCRGCWENLCLNEDTLTFSTLTAWTPAYEVIELLRQKYPGTEYFYYAEEPGSRLYETNDKDGLYYPMRFVAHHNDGKECHETRPRNACEVRVIETNEALTPYFDESGKGYLVRPDGTIAGEFQVTLSDRPDNQKQ